MTSGAAFSSMDAGIRLVVSTNPPLAPPATDEDGYSSHKQLQPLGLFDLLHACPTYHGEFNLSHIVCPDIALAFPINPSTSHPSLNAGNIDGTSS